MSENISKVFCKRKEDYISTCTQYIDNRKSYASVKHTGIFNGKNKLVYISPWYSCLIYKLIEMIIKQNQNIISFKSSN